MLTFMDSKLPHDWRISEKKSHIFQKSKSYEISSTDIYFGEYLEVSSQNNFTYYPMTCDTDVTYQTVNIFSSDKCFICSISDVPHYIMHVEQ